MDLPTGPTKSTQHLYQNACNPGNAQGESCRHNQHKHSQLPPEFALN